jgi:ATP-dependent RNA helicase DHX36
VESYGETALVACYCWKENEVYMDLIMDLIFYFHKQQPKGDGAILVFLPGWGDISKAFIELYRSGENFKLIALHSLMTPEQQQEAFERPPKGKRKVVLSTNIAEASVTINDVVYVIDCGVRKERSYDPTTSVSSLDAKMVTKANAIQRRGRAGRVQEGLVVHLFPSYKMADFEEFPLPQMLTSSMDEVVLQTMVICATPVGDIEKMLMGSMAAPKKEAIGDAVKGLKKIDCLTAQGHLTALGRACASIPVQPNVARMLLLAGAFRCIKTASVVAAFLSVKNPFQQSPGQGSGGDTSNKKTGKEYFNKGFNSDHLTSLQAYVEWRRAVKAGHGDDFCDEMGLSPETMDMAHMMAQQFTSFMMEAGYDGNDVREEDCPAIRRGSEDDALLRCAMAAGFCPNFVALYYGNRSPYWYLCDNSEVYPFGGSVNKNYQMSGKDGDEWMVYSDAMVMGRGHSIMDSSLVFSPFVLLFSKAILIDEAKGEIRFDNWWANINPKDPVLKEVLDMRSQVLPKFKEAIEGRDLSIFPKQLTQRMAKACMSAPIALKNMEPMRKSIDEETTGALRRRLSIYEWPVDEGAGAE